MDGLKAQIETLYQQIENETKRIQGYQEEITHYGNQCAWMDNQLNSTHASLYLFYRDTMPQMKAQRERMIQNELKVRIHQKKHIVQKQRFERYRKVMSIDTRLAELKKKIQVAWKQDEVWLGIRDWGLLSSKTRKSKSDKRLIILHSYFYRCHDDHFLAILNPF